MCKLKSTVNYVMLGFGQGMLRKQTDELDE